MVRCASGLILLKVGALWDMEKRESLMTPGGGPSCCCCCFFAPFFFGGMLLTLTRRRHEAHEAHECAVRLYTGVRVRVVHAARGERRPAATVANGAAISRWRPT